MPQSTAHTTRSTANPPLVDRRDLGDLRDVRCRTTRAPRSPRGAPCRERLAPARLLGREVRARRDGADVLASSARRNATGSLPAACASSSMKVSVDERRVRVPDRAPPQHRDAGPSCVCRSTAMFGIVEYGESARPRPTCRSMPSFTIIASNGVPAMIDWPTMRCCHATDVARRVEPGAQRVARTSGGSSRRACRPRASTRA